MEECLFCKMVAGEIKPDVVYETSQVLAFRDIDPQAPTHVLVIPKRHVDSINALTAEDKDLVGNLYLAAKAVAEQEGIAESGYRTLMNCNEDGGQSVYHVHLHVLGGRRMQWPPG